MSSVVISNLAPTMNPVLLKGMFDRFGEVTVSDFKGETATIDFKTEDFAKQAIANMNTTNLFGMNGDKQIWMQPKPAVLQDASNVFPAPFAVPQQQVQQMNPMMQQQQPQQMGQMQGMPGMNGMGNMTPMQMGGMQQMGGMGMPGMQGMPGMNGMNMMGMQQPMQMQQMGMQGMPGMPGMPGQMGVQQPPQMLQMQPLQISSVPPKKFITSFEGDANPSQAIKKLVDIYQGRDSRLNFETSKTVTVFDSYEEFSAFYASKSKMIPEGEGEAEPEVEGEDKENINTTNMQIEEPQYVDARKLTVDRLKSAVKKRNLNVDGPKNSLIYTLEKYNTEI